MFHGYFPQVKLQYMCTGGVLDTREHIDLQTGCSVLQTLKNGYVVTYWLFVGIWPVNRLPDMKDGPVLRMWADKGRVFVSFVPSVC
jgi:hypothetical protein